MTVRAWSLATPAAAVVTALALASGCGDSASERRADRFDSAAAMGLVKLQVGHGPRPAGSRASRRLAERLRGELPQGRFQRVRGGLRNVIGTVPGREPKRVVVVGAHYDTKDIPGFLGAVDGASGTAVTVQLARTLKPRRAGPTVVFALFDGEESPRGAPDTYEGFVRTGLRGSKVAARAYREASAMVLLDFVGERNARFLHEGTSDPALWERVRAAARKAGAGDAFPKREAAEVADDHLPFLNRGIAAVDLIDFDFACFHKLCDDLSQVSERSLDITGETVMQLLLDF